MLAELISDVVGTLSPRPGCPTLRLVATDQPRTWTLGEDSDPDEVRGPAAGLAAWLVGRSKGRDLRTVDGARPPAPPRWLCSAGRAGGCPAGAEAAGCKPGRRTRLRRRAR